MIKQDKHQTPKKSASAKKFYSWTYCIFEQAHQLDLKLARISNSSIFYKGIKIAIDLPENSTRNISVIRLNWLATKHSFLQFKMWKVNNCRLQIKNLTDFTGIINYYNHLQKSM
jgi:hypothetical protein